MSYRNIALAIALGASSACSSTAQRGSAPRHETEEQLVARARGIHERVITIDTHDDIPLNFATPEVDPGVRGTRQVDLPKMREGGLDVAFFAVFVGQTPRTAENYQKAKDDAMAKFRAIHRLTKEMHPDKIELATSADDVERIARSGKLVAAIGIENGYVIGKDLSLIKTYYDLGARYMTLAHTSNNDICDSSNDRNGPEHGGLSAFGRQVVAEMNRVGMMVDISHVSKECMMQATALSKAPVIASHSSTRALADVPRDMDDEQLLALKKSGGVMQTVAFDGYVKVQPPEKQQAIAALRQEFGLTTGAPGAGGAGGGGGGRLAAALAALSPERRAEYDRRLADIEQRWPRATVKDFVNHIDHAVKVMGIDHVGISSDFDGGGGITGWNSAAETFNVTLELVRRGYSEKDIAKLWSGNILRVWREADKVAATLQRTATH